MPSAPSSLLFHPLDHGIGRVSHVRILRTLGLHGGALAPTEIARRTGLSRRGAWKAIAALEAAGLLERVGSGHSVPFRLNETHPLMPALRRLFEEEAGRADHVLEAIRTAAAGLNPAPLGVWLFGSVARGEDRLASDLDVALVAERGDLAREQADRLREALEPVAERWAVRPSVISLSRSELRALREEDATFWGNLVQDAVPLAGSAPESLTGAGR